MHCNNCNSVYVAKYGTRLWLITDGTEDNSSAGRSASLSGNDLEGVQHLTGWDCHHFLREAEEETFLRGGGGGQDWWLQGNSAPDETVSYPSY